MIIESTSEYQVYKCTFQAYVDSALMKIKFPCSYYVEWRSMNGKILMAASKNIVGAVNSTATFEELLHFQTELLYNLRTREYQKKQCLLLLNLISKRRPDQQKLVGRRTVDLAQIANQLKYEQQKDYELDYCSVNASIRFKAKMLGKKLSNTSPQNFDQDSFNDYQSFLTGIHRENRARQTPNLSQSNEQRTIQISRPHKDVSWRTKKEQIQLQRGIIEESNNEDYESRMGTQRNTPRSIHGFDKHLSVKSNQNLLKLQESQSEKNNKNSVIIHEYSRKDDSMYRNESKRLWQEEKRLINEQLTRQKLQSQRYKQKYENYEKKLYEVQLKYESLMGKIDNHKKEMSLLSKEKDLQIRELRMQIERVKQQKHQIELELEKVRRDKSSKNEDYVLKYENTYAILQNQRRQRRQLQMSIKQLQLKVHEYKMKAEGSKQLDSLKLRYKLVMDELEQEKQRVKVEERKNQSSLNKLQKYFKEIQQLANKLDQQKDSRRQLEQGKQRLRHECEQGIRQKEAYLNEAKGQVQILKKYARQVEEENINLKIDYSKLKEQMETKQSQLILYSDIKQEFETKENILKQKEQTVQYLTQILQEKQQQLQTVVHQLQDKEQKINNLILQLQNSKNYNSQGDAPNSNTHTQQIDQLKQKDSKRQKEMKLLYQQIAQQTQKQFELMQQLAAKQMQISLQNREGTNVEKAQVKDNNKQYIEELQTMILKNEQDLAQLRSQTDNNKEYVQELQAHILKNKQKQDQLQRTFDNNKQYIQELQMEILKNHDKRNQEERVPTQLPQCSVEWQIGMKEKIKEKENRIKALQMQLYSNNQYINSLQGQVLTNYDKYMTINNEKQEQMENRVREIGQENQQEMMMLRNSHKIQLEQFKSKIQKIQKQLNNNNGSKVSKGNTSGQSQKYIGKIKQLEEETVKLNKEIIMLQNNPKYDDEDYLLLQQKLQEQQKYTTQLQQQLKSNNNNNDDANVHVDQLNLPDNQQFNGMVRIIPAYSEGSQASSRKNLQMQILKIDDKLQYEGSRMQEPPKLNKIDSLQHSPKMRGSMYLPHERKEEAAQLWKSNRINQELVRKIEQVQLQVSQIREQNFELQLQRQTLIKRYKHEKQQLIKQIKNLHKDNKEVQNKLLNVVISKSIVQLSHQSPQHHKMPQQQSSDMVEFIKSQINNQHNHNANRQESQEFSKYKEEYVTIIREREQIIDELNNQVHSLNDVIGELQNKIITYKQKEHMMKESLVILEEESNRIIRVIQERDNVIIQLKQEIKVKENQSTIFREEAQRKSVQQQSNKESKSTQHFIREINTLKLRLVQEEQKLLTNKKLTTILQNNNARLQAQREEDRKVSQRVQDLEQQLFVYQSNQNQKQIKIKDLQEQVKKLKQLLLQNSKNGIQQNNNLNDNNIETIGDFGKIQTIQNINIGNMDSVDHLQEVLRLKNQVQQLQSRLANSEEYVRSLEEEVLKQYNLNAQSNNNNDDNGKYAQLQQKHNELSLKLLQLEEQLQAKELQINGVQEILKEERLQHYRSKREINIRISQLQGELSQANKNTNNVDQNNKEQENQQLGRLRQQIGIINQQLTEVTQKYDKLQCENGQIKEKVQEYESKIRIFTDQKEQLLIKLSEKKESLNNESNSNGYEIQVLKKEIQDKIKKQIQLQTQLASLRENLNNCTLKSEKKIVQIQQELQMSYHQGQKLKAQIQEKQMQHMNTQLNLQFKLKEKNEKSQSQANNLKKSFNASMEHSAMDIVPASKKILQLLQERLQKNKNQLYMEMMLSKIAQNQQLNFNSHINIREKGMILEKTRLLSMEFSKLKVFIMKSKINYDDRTKIMNNLKPFDTSIKDILNVSESFADSLMEGSRSVDKIDS